MTKLLLLFFFLLFLFQISSAEDTQEKFNHVQYIEMVIQNLEEQSQKLQTQLQTQSRSLALDHQIKLQPQLLLLKNILRQIHTAKKRIQYVNTALHRPLLPRHLILDFISKATYARLGKSKLPNGGVGLFAIQDIPPHVSPIPQIDSACSDLLQEPALVHISEMNPDSVAPSVKKLLYDFINPYNGSYLIPAGGLNSITPDFYMNHNSENPNIGVFDVPECAYLVFRTLREVKQGEELTFDYQSYGNTEDYLKDMLEAGNSKIMVKDEL